MVAATLMIGRDCCEAGGVNDNFVAEPPPGVLALGVTAPDELDAANRQLDEAQAALREAQAAHALLDPLAQARQKEADITAELRAEENKGKKAGKKKLKRLEAALLKAGDEVGQAQATYDRALEAKAGPARGDSGQRDSRGRSSADSSKAAEAVIVRDMAGESISCAVSGEATARLQQKQLRRAGPALDLAHILPAELQDPLERVELLNGQRDAFAAFVRDSTIKAALVPERYTPTSEENIMPLHKALHSSFDAYWWTLKIRDDGTVVPRPTKLYEYGANSLLDKVLWENPEEKEEGSRTPLDKAVDLKAERKTGVPLWVWWVYNHGWLPKKVAAALETVHEATVCAWCGKGNLRDNSPSCSFCRERCHKSTKQGGRCRELHEATCTARNDNDDK